MRPALQPHTDSRGYLNFLNQIIRPDLNLHPNPREIALHALSGALCREIAKTISIFGFLNALRIRNELEQRFTQQAVKQIMRPDWERKSRDVSSNKCDNAEMRTKMYTLYTFELSNECLVTLRNEDLSAPRTAFALFIKNQFATDNQRKGCERWSNSAGVAEVRSGRMLEQRRLNTRKPKRRTKANAAPVAARSSGRRSRTEDSQKTVSEQYTDSEHTTCEPSSCSSQEVKRRKTWVLRRDHGRLGVWIGRPADQQVTQGLLASAGGSYYNDREGLNMVASTAHGYGELGAATLRPSAVSVGFYTQLWWYSQVLGKKQQEAISASFNEGILGTGVAKFYNTYNPFVAFANTYQTAKINSALYGTDQANLWRNEIVSGIGGPAFKADKITGELDYKLTMQDLIGAVPLIGGIINSGIDYDMSGNQRRGGWKWNPQEGGAAVTTAAAGLLFSVYGVYGAEYVNKQTYGEQYSNYDQLGVGTGLGSTIGAYAGAIAAAFGMQAANAEFDAENGAGASKGLTRAEADAANATSATHQGAGILQGSGYALGLRRYGNYLGQQVEGIGMGAFDSNGFTGIGAAAGGVANWFAGVVGGSVYSLLNATTNVSQRVGNFFSADFNGDRWNWETDQEQSGRAQVFAEDQIRSGDYDRAREALLASGAKANQVDDYLNQRKKVQADYAANKDSYLKSAAYLVMGDLVGDNHGYSNNEKYNQAVARLGELAGNEPPTQAMIEQVSLEMHGRPMDWDRAIQGKGLLIGIDQAKFGQGGQALKDFTSGKSNVLPAGILPPNTTLVIDGRRIETDSSGAASRVVPDDGLAGALLGVLLSSTAESQATLGQMEQANNKPFMARTLDSFRNATGIYDLKNKLQGTWFGDLLYGSREENDYRDKFNQLSRAVASGVMPLEAFEAWKNQVYSVNRDLRDVQTFIGGASPISGIAGGTTAAAGSVVKVAGTRGLIHSFDRHAAQWFGREVSSATHLRHWQSLVERTLQSSKQVPWSTRGKETIGYLAKIDGKSLFVQVYKEGLRANEIATAFVVQQKQLRAILSLLK